MLKDRRALLEQEIKKAHEEASNMYLSIVIGGGDIYSEDYQKLKEHITDLQFDLNMVNSLIYKGHE
jgi:methylmalonyl-CoA mutase cobalamin-binding subunit